MYKDFIILYSLIIVHEMGHFLMAKLFNWQIDNITIYLFGGCVKFKETLNKPLYQELLIMLMGPISQILYFLLILLLTNKGYISYRDYLIFKTYNNTLLIFNLLPIIPLDGGRLLNIIINFLLPFKLGNKLVIGTSYLILFILTIKELEFNYILMYIFLFIEISKYLKKQDYLFNKFLLERYLNKYHFKKLKKINNKDYMYRSCRHLIKDDNRYLTEKEYLNRRFKF